MLSCLVRCLEMKCCCVWTLRTKVEPSERWFLHISLSYNNLLADFLSDMDEDMAAVCGSYRTDEAGVVPGVAQRLDELIPGFDREVTAVTLSAEECDVI